jgi:membrane associated rhomboid family serine protease
MAVCYRHPGRETAVSCSNCGKPICPDCMTATPVGMRCPDCSRQRTQVRTLRNIYADPTATYVLIGINVLMFLGMMLAGGRGGAVYEDLVTVSVAGASDGGLLGVAEGQYWRLVTGGFLHSTNPIHILFNMYALYWLGLMLEPVLGHVRFVALYFASLLAGSLGALAWASPDTPTVGASGAVFGLMAAAFVFQQARGVDPMRSGLGPVILFNLALPFLFPGLNISVGGHVGGLIGGGLAALAIDRLAGVRRGNLLPVLACAAIGAVSVAGAIAVSSAKASEVGLALLL